MSFEYRDWREAMLRNVPETAAWLRDASYDGLPYAAMSDLAAFVHNGIMAATASDVFVDNAVGLWTEMADSDDPDVQALLVSGALEVLVGSRVVIDTLRRRMGGRLRNLYEYTILTRHGDEPPNWFEVDINDAPSEDAVRRALESVPA